MLELPGKQGKPEGKVGLKLRKLPGQLHYSTRTGDYNYLQIFFTSSTRKPGAAAVVLLWIVSLKASVMDCQEQ